MGPYLMIPHAAGIRILKAIEFQIVRLHSSQAFVILFKPLWPGSRDFAVTAALDRWLAPQIIQLAPIWIVSSLETALQHTACASMNSGKETGCHYSLIINASCNWTIPQVWHLWNFLPADTVRYHHQRQVLGGRRQLKWGVQDCK